MILLMNPALLAWGNPPPGRWEKVAETKLGAKITVYTKDGSGLEYIYAAINEEFLICATEYEGKIPIELTTINKVTLHKRGKYMGDGILYGFLGGLATGALVGYVISPSDDVGVNYMNTLYITVAGTAAGFLCGAAIGSPETIYISKEAALEK